jgi:large subunit ribosomal protein L22|tara:strand:+ start:7519 stop:7881 length:363 start_codon:yes stop_codon:yes gene_type:complete
METVKPNKIKDFKSISKYIRMSPTKIRRVTNYISGCTYKDAIRILEFLPYRSCKVLLDTIKSAASNAEHNYGLSKSNLYIKSSFVNSGPIIKRIRPRAQGRAFPIHKCTSHVTVILGEVT